MLIEEKLVELFKEAFKELYSVEMEDTHFQIQPTRKDFEGSHTLVCFPLARYTKKNPEESAMEIGSYLKSKNSIVADFNVVKGFLNLVLSDLVWVEQLNELNLNQEKQEGVPEELMVEYSSPNTNKPLHLGHLRNIFLGWSISKIFDFLGTQVHKVQIINDRGIHICKSMVAWEKYGEAATPESKGVKGDKFVGDFYVAFDSQYKKEINELIAEGKSRQEAEQQAPIFKEAKELLLKWEAKDPETVDLWKKMNGWVYNGFDTSYERMGVTFDKLYFESETYLLGKDVVMKGLAEGLFFQKEDGSVWVDLSAEGLDEKLLLRSDGTSVYMTQDIGTAILRYKDYPGIDGQIYTVGNEQEYHFKVLFLILAKLGYKWASECYHLSYGMVDLPTGKMKSREGTVVDADDIMQEVVDKAREKTEELGKIDTLSVQEASKLYENLGLGALKYYLLKVDPRKRMLFNPEESVDIQGNTGPFIQYTHARISSLLRKADELQIDIPDQFENVVLEEVEVELIKRLVDFKTKVREAAKDHSPAVIAAYVYDLAKDYNKLWQNVVVLKEEDEQKRNLRLGLSKWVAEVIRVSLDLLGIEAPERM